MSARHGFELSLNDLIGNRLVVDVYGYMSSPFGGDPSFKLTRVLLSDGTTIGIEGEHDFPYLCDSDGVVTMPEVSR